MIDPMYRVEHRGFEVTTETTKGNDKTSKTKITGRSYCPDGVMYENFSGTHIAWFARTGESRGFLVTLYFIKGGGAEDWKVENDLSELCRNVWKRYWKSLSRREKAKRCLYAHRAWIAALITSVIASSITLGVSYFVSQIPSGNGTG